MKVSVLSARVWVHPKRLRRREAKHLAGGAGSSFSFRIAAAAPNQEGSAQLQERRGVFADDLKWSDGARGYKIHAPDARLP